MRRSRNRHAGGGGIARIGTREEAQCERQILDVPGDDTDRIEARRQRHGPGAADATPGRLDGGDAARGSRQAQRAAGVGAHAGGNRAVGNRRGRAGRRAAGDARRVPRIARVTQHVVVPRGPKAKLGQMQGCDLQGAGHLEAGDSGSSSVAGRSARMRAPQLAILPLRSNMSLCARGTPASGPPGGAGRDCSVGRLGCCQRLVGLERDDAVGQLVAGLELLDGRLVASTLDTFLSRMALARPRADSAARFFMAAWPPQRARGGST